MKIELKYFSGTGNSYKILDTIKSVFEENDNESNISSITSKIAIDMSVDLLGFCFPVYAYGIPRISRKYLSSLPKQNSNINAFIIITAGDANESGFSINECKKILEKKGINVIYSDVIEMPSNWTTHLELPPLSEVLNQIDLGNNKATEIAENILKGNEKHHVFNFPTKISKIKFYSDYYLFKWLGVSNMWRNFRVESSCKLCGLCAKNCPTESIKIIDSNIKWSNTCEQCMRCVNYCPSKSIYQNNQGSIRNKNVYYEPSFNPSSTEKKV